MWRPGDRPTARPRASRSVVLARNGVVATSQPLASAAGLQVLMEGGNAVDAAVTAAATLAVVEPTMTGIGGDLFAMVHDGRAVHALNASGRAPRRATIAALRARFTESPLMPAAGIFSVSVPGAVDGWDQLLAQHGTITLARALAPAIDYAHSGFAVSEVVAGQWRAVDSLLATDAHAAATFLPQGRAPSAGEVFANPRLAATLEALAHDGAETMYRGAVAERVAADAERRGGWLGARDLAEHRSDWVTPLRTTFLGREVLELPPNTQGLTAIEILNLIGNDDLPALGHNSPAYLHLLIEAIRIAFADRAAHIADPAAVPADVVEHLTSAGYAATRRTEIDPKRAAAGYAPWRRAAAAPPPRIGTGDTVYLATADRHGQVVSLIQSLFGAFGSGVVAGDTGIVLQNRASLFSTDPSHPNCLGPAKRPFHTLIPAMVLEGGRPALAFGVMGGDMQAQGHAQVLANILAFGMNVQEAGEAARARWTGDGVALESGIAPATRDGLTTRGHRLIDEPGGFGGFQGVQIDAERGVLLGGSDPRKDGSAVGY